MEEFRKEFEKWLLTRTNDGLTIEYERPPSSYKLQAWLQNRLDEFGVKSAEFRLVNGTLFIENVVYDEMGRPCPCYEITYSSEVQNPDTIKEIKVV